MQSIELSLFLGGNLLFFFVFFYFVFGLNFQVQAPRGGLYLEGRFNGGIFALRVWGGGGLIFGGAYLRNFTVFVNSSSAIIFIYLFFMAFL